MTLTLSWRRAEDGGRDKNGEWNNHSPPPPALHPSLSSWASIDRDLCISRGLAGNGGKRVLGQHTCERVKENATSFFNWTWLGKQWGNGGPDFSRVCWLVPWAEAGHCALGMLLKEL